VRRISFSVDHPLTRGGTVDSTTTSQGYEFNARENAIIGDTAGWIQKFAWIAILGGVLSAIGGVFSLPSGLASIAVGVFYLVIGMWFKGAAQSLASVVSTEGNDVSHLLSALKELGKAYKVMVALTVLLLVCIPILAAVVGIMGIEGAL
jgi:hypothetical protein